MGAPGVLDPRTLAAGTYDDVCVVVPMFNEAAVVGDVVAGLRRTFDRVVCVDDGSHDASGTIARDAGATVVRHPVNLGMGAALQTGLTYALRDPAFQHFVTFDADGQHRVPDATAMVDLARQDGVDVVLGSRFLGEGSAVPHARRMVLRGAVYFTRLTSGLTLSDAHNGLRVLNRNAARQIHITLNGMAHASEIIEQISAHRLRWAEHPVTIDYTEYSQAKGQSNINAINISLDVIGRRLRTAGRS